MGCNCGDNEYEIIVDNNGSCEPTTPEYYITLENVGVDGFSPTINQVNVTSSSFQLQITDVNGTETTGDIPLLSYLNNNFVTNTSLASTLTAYVTNTSLANTLTNYVTNTSLATTLADYVTNSNLTTTLTNYVTNSSLSSTLNNYVTSSSLSSTLSAYALDANVVHKANTETITGKKTFSSPIYTNVIKSTGSGGAGNILSLGTYSGGIIYLGYGENDEVIIGGYSSTGISLTGTNIYLNATSATLNNKNIATVDQIPTVGNGTITITQGGVSKGTFTTNQSSNTTIDLDTGGGVTNPIEFTQTYNDGEGTVTTATLTLGLEDTGYPYPIAKVQYNSTHSGGSDSWSEYFINTTRAKNKGGLKNNYGSSTYSSINQLEVDVDNSTIAINNSGKVYAKEMTGADSITGGSSGLVPAPSAGDQKKYLRGDGTWQTVTGGSSYTAGTGIDITNDTISIDTSVVAQLSDIPDTSDMATQTWVGNQGYLTSASLANYVTTNTAQTISGVKTFNANIKINDGKAILTQSGYEALSVVGEDVTIGNDRGTLYLWSSETRPVYNFSSYLALTSDIPTVNNPTITFTQGGVSKGTITLNQSSNQTIALDAGGGGGGATIDDTTPSTTKVYSSQKTQDLIDALVARIMALEANINGGNA